MCGICGFAVGPKSGWMPSSDVIQRMRDVITHRGPDGAGTFCEPGLALGHRRLSIVDVAHGAQPMASDDGQLQLIFNGEIFNHPMLSAELQASGVRYHTHCDTETILRLYERVGQELPNKLRGMFAIALWDRRKRELFLVRDRLGVKPLYYAHLDDGTLLFASEIKSILESGRVPASFNMRTLPDYLANHAPSGDETMFAGIRRLPAGHTLRWKDGEIAITPYWDLHYGPTDTRSDAVLVDEYRERFTEAVRLRLMADVPLGMFLSGGIDSAAITAAMSTLVSDPIKTFSVGFAEREANEFHYARLVAARYKTDHHEVTVSPTEFWEALPRLLWHEDEPIAHPSSIALNFVSRLAAERVKVVLTGEGSDETLAGYNRYRVTLYNLRFARMLEGATTDGMRQLIRQQIAALPAGGVRRRLERTFLAIPNDFAALYFDNFAVFGRAAQARLLSASTRDSLGQTDPYAMAQAALDRCDASTLLDKLLYADTKTYLHELLMKQDQMSMAASIESRVPFLDHPLVEFTATLPERVKLRGVTTKWILREAMRDRLPAEILSRKKMGFPVPVGDWLRGAWRPLLDEFVLGERATARGLFATNEFQRLVHEHSAAERNHAERLWSLINLEIWQRIFLDGESPGDIVMRGH